VKRLVDLYTKTANPKGEDPEVYITLSEPSVCARAKCDISGIFEGFDWENGQIRIEPKENLVHKGRSKDDELEMKAYKYRYDRRTMIKYHCPTCEETLSKSANYCSNCGQKVKTPQTLTFTHDYRTDKS